MTNLAIDELQNPNLCLLERYTACKGMARGYAETVKTDAERVRAARSFCAEVVLSFWWALARQNDAKIKPATPSAMLYLDPINPDAQSIAANTGELISQFPVEDAGYLIGSIYTVMLPSSLRSKLGAFYTPPPLVSRLLDSAQMAGIDFSKNSVLDPACGGGAFLVPAALRIVKATPQCSAEWLIRRLGKQLKGFEIDPFAAWMAHVLVEAAIMPLCVKSQRRLPKDLITVTDSLSYPGQEQYDLVVGNPPYGKVTLGDDLRAKYSRSLYGHANLYGLFTDLALRLVKSTGVVAYLTPTSFLGGQYFMALRSLLTQEATPVNFEFISDRDGVFDDVLQETLLTTFKVGKAQGGAKVFSVVPKGLNAAKAEYIGTITVPSGGEPWLIPRQKSESAFLKKIKTMPGRLRELGYSVSTGQLVWNRFKDQLSTVNGDCKHPLIWAESINSDGFYFRADKRNHVPFIHVKDNQSYLLTKKSCVILQRTTSKEQDSRLLAAIIPQSFIDKYNGVVIENHINILCSANGLIANETVSFLLNSSVADRAFRCISGSVAVSAYELNALPIPSLKQMLEIQSLLQMNVSRDFIESKLNKFYGVKD